MMCKHELNGLKIGSYVIYDGPQQSLLKTGKVYRINYISVRSDFVMVSDDGEEIAVYIKDLKYKYPFMSGAYILNLLRGL